MKALSFNLLKKDSDEVLKYFAWNALNECCCSYLVHIMNNTHPSLKQMLDNFFSACEKYEKGKQGTEYYGRSTIRSDFKHQDKARAMVV